MRRFEFEEGGSKKFWQIEQSGKSYTVIYGRIGAAGVSKTTDCDSPAAAQAEVEKLVREKLKKGYQEIGAATSNWRPPKPIPHHENVSHFMGYAVVGFDPAADEGAEDDNGRKIYAKLRDLDRRIYKIGLTFDDKKEMFVERLNALLDDPKVDQLKALVLGNWWGDVSESGDASDFVKLLIERKDRLANLQGLFIGDVTPEENEISWINNDDYGRLVSSLPGLKEVLIRGAGTRLSQLSHETLQGLTLQSGGLAAEAVRDVGAAHLPELRRLTLWLGDDNYGGDSEPKDFAKILSGKQFPKLEYLGLMNARNTDDIAKLVAESSLVARLKGLDLSMGTLGDEGAEALLASPAIKKLTTLNLQHHYMTPAVSAKWKKLGIEVDVSERIGPDEHDEGNRYCEVSE